MTIPKLLLCLVPCAALCLAPSVFAEDAAAPAGEKDVASKTMTAQAAEPTQTLELAEVAVCRNVENHTPIEDATSFPADVGKLFCFTDVRNAQEPTQIFHRWYIGDKMINEIPMTVRGPRWRCWSEKTIMTSWTGDCRVEIVTEEGNVIGTMSFDLQQTGVSHEPSAQQTSEG